MRKYLVLTLFLLCSQMFYSKSVNSSPKTGKLTKCPFTIRGLIERTNKEYSLPSDPKRDNFLINQYKALYLVGSNRAGLIICSERGNASKSTYLVKTVDSKFREKRYFVDCDEFTLTPIIKSYYKTPRDLRDGRVSYQLGPSIMVNEGTIGDGILTNYCQAYWDGKNRQK